MNYKQFCSIVLLALIFTFSCNEPPIIPKSVGYFRINFPKKVYQPYKGLCFFSSEIPKYSTIKYKKQPDSKSKDCWVNLSFDSLNAVLYLTHKIIKLSDLNALTEDTRALVYKHSIKANDIKTSIIKNTKSKIYGLEYEVFGTPASYYQFYITDSNSNFLRGSLYFNTSPNQDSLNPVITFIKKDISHLINTLKWNPQ